MPPLHIGVIADTHGRFPKPVADSLREADEIWHLGDFCDLATLDAVRAINRPFLAVRGNNDTTLDLPNHLRIERNGRSFSLIHILPNRPGGADFLLHGHTHVPCDEIIGATRILNPGAVGKPNKGAPPAWAWLDVAADGSVTWTPQRV